MSLSQLYRTYYIAHEALLSVTWQLAWERSCGRMDTCICMAESLSCSPETIMNNIVNRLFRAKQSLSHIRLFATPWIAACQASLSITNSWSSLRLMSIESVMPSNHLILHHPLLLTPSILPAWGSFQMSQFFTTDGQTTWSFSFSISPSNEHPGLILFRMDWLDLLVVQGTLRSLLQHHSSKASILGHSAFFTVQLEKPYPWLDETLLAK